MSLKDQIQIEPVRTLSAVLALGAAVVTGLAYGQGWSGEAVGLISAGWSAFIAVIGTFFVRNSVTPNANLDALIEDTIKALAPYAPKIIDLTVPVATSPLIDPPHAAE